MPKSARNIEKNKINTGLATNIQNINKSEEKTTYIAL